MKLKDMDYKTRNELAELLEAWLYMYTDECVVRVMNRLDEITENEMAMHMLRELKKRQEEEKKQRKDAIGFLFYRLQEGKINDAGTFHNHCLEHSSSYRDVLYDLYIKK